MRDSSRAPTAAVLSVTVLLLLCVARRARAPEPEENLVAFSAAPSASAMVPPPLAPTTPAKDASASTFTDRMELVRRCLRLGETDPLAAMDLAIAQKLTDHDPGLLNALVLRWAERDFSGALEWARAQPPEAARDDILAHLAFLRSSNAPAAAAEIAATEIAGPRARAEAILGVAHQWAQRAPDAALAWSTRLAEEDLRQRVLDDIAAVARTQAVREAR